MSMQDPIADMFTCIRNAQAVGEKTIRFPSSKFKIAILKVLEEEGYINDFEVLSEGGKRDISLNLKYYQDRPVIDKLKRVSTPGLRVYKRFNQLAPILGGMGIAIVSTPRGVMTDKNARSQKLGGEIVCLVE